MSDAIDPRRCALLLIDLQNDFLAGDGAYARAGLGTPGMATLVERLAPLVRAFRAAGAMVAASRFTLWPDAAGEPMIADHLRRLRPFLRRGDFAPDSRGQAVVDALRGSVTVAVDKVAYSAFFSTQLDWVLRHAGVDTVALAGIVTNGGVASTVRDAHVREYHPIVVADGCEAFSAEAHRNALADMAGIADCIDIATLRARLAGASGALPDAAP